VPKLQKQCLTKFNTITMVMDQSISLIADLRPEGRIANKIVHINNNNQNKQRT